MSQTRRIVALLLVPLLAAAGAAHADGLVETGVLAGRVTSDATPLASAAVYAYQLADLRLWKGTTDTQGRFRFEGLPAGLYKIITAKNGFLPAIVKLTRGSVATRQWVEVQLLAEPEGLPAHSSFWSVREQIPSDVLRDLGLPIEAETLARGTEPAVELETRLQALTGLDESLAADGAQLSGGQLDVRGEIRDVQLDLKGDFSQLQPLGLASDLSGTSQALVFNLAGMGDARMQLSSTSNRLRMGGDSPELIGLESHRVSWSQPLGAGQSRFAAQYTVENNFYNSGLWAPQAIPLASRSWRLEGSYATPLTERASLETGFRYRERQSRHALDAGDGLLPSEQVELFGRGGMQITPGVLLEYGLYSTLRDGTVWLTPRGGVVLQLGSSWQAGSSVSSRIRAEEGDTYPASFATAYHGDGRPCEQGEEVCYRVYLVRESEDGRLSIGAAHREFAETLRLYFNRDFFNLFESLYLVEGDTVPELQFELERRLAPGVRTRLESSLAAGGGGILLATNSVPYENDVRYLVTSLDTQFERTSTGVFLSFHHLAQQLSPTLRRHQRHSADMALERLQLTLTQELDVLDRLASDLALQLNMEFSRGSLPAGRQYEDPDELRRRVTGGLTVRF